jgi:hypothetical protein
MKNYSASLILTYLWAVPKTKVSVPIHLAQDIIPIKTQISRIAELVSASHYDCRLY